jgi:tetratricopeptide (TPR) repeat protein
VNWDDPSYITENPMVMGGLSWKAVWWALTTGHTPYWHPMTWLSHLLDITMFGSDTGGYHLTSLLLHAANTALVFEGFRRLTTDVWRSAFVAAMFAVHPLHVESVAWIAERKDVLSTFFWALTLLAYVAYVGRPSARRYAVMCLGYVLALMSKPMVVTLPALLLLLDVWPLARFTKRAVLEKIPLFLLAVAASVVTVVIQHRIGAMARFDVLPWPTRAGNALVAYVAYLAKTFWPVGLAAFYPPFSADAGRIAACGLLLAVLTGAAVRMRPAYPFVFVGWFWFLVALAPVIGFLQSGEQSMADRFMYVPLIGLAVILAWGVPVVANRRVPNAVTAFAAVVAILACAGTAHAQVLHWHDSVTLWEHAMEVTSGNYLAHENLGQALRDRGDLERSREHYERALALAPAGSITYAAIIHNSLGMVLLREDKPGEALDQFAQAARLDPTFAEAQTNLGNALASGGRPAEAIDHYRVAIARKPDYVEPRVGLGAALLSQGKAADAIPCYREALRLDPNLAQAHNGLGGALATEGHDAEAMQEYEEALRLKPDLPTAHLNIALLLVKQGRKEEARRHLDAALSIDPGYEPARRLLAALGGQPY